MNNRTEAKCTEQCTKADNAAGKVTDQCTDGVGGHAMPEIRNIWPSFGCDQGQAVIRGNACIGCLIEGYAEAGDDNTDTDDDDSLP